LRLRQGRYSLSPAERIKDRRDFSRIFRLGSRVRAPGFTIVFAPNQLGYSRIGISAGRRFGRAVQRNRAKRIFRELFRLHKHDLPRGVDYIFLPSKELFSRGWTRLEEDLMKAAERVQREMLRIRSLEDGADSEGRARSAQNLGVKSDESRR